MLNLLEVKPGQKVRLKSGEVCEVVENIGDGIWLQLRKPGGMSEDELVHCEEMVALVESNRG